MSYENLFDQLASAGFEQWVEHLRQQQAHWLVQHGDYPRWSKAISSLPAIDNVRGIFDSDAITIEGQCPQKEQLHSALKGLSPWRKGPYQIADVHIDSEWRSDYKWSRVLPHLKPLNGRRILDVGCGNGYHCWRMLAEYPKFVLGVEPSALFNLQFAAIQHYLKRSEISLLPIGIEAMPKDMNWFDTVFSMGVLYHRRSPLDHLYQLKSLLAPGGELCLETLVIDAGAGQVLVPEDRYARMNNVWFLPGPEELLRWLKRCGFVDIQLIDVSLTTMDEQRSTDWMQFESLVDSLDSKNHQFTVEGLPAPKRAIILARKKA